MINKKFNMKRIITITLDKAKEWFNSEDESLKEIALQAFSENELKFDFRNITTFEKACEALSLDYDDINSVIADMIVFSCSKSSAAMFKLNIIRKALNLGQDLHLTKNPKDSHIYYPYNPFIITKKSSCYNSELNSGRVKIIGKIKSEGEEYNVLSGFTKYGSNGLGNFYLDTGKSDTDASVGFLGCASKEIAQHFGKYFGMLITEAKYGDLPDFEIVESKY